MPYSAGDSSSCPIFVIGAGIGRTGTTSLKRALEILYQMPCYHMATVVYEHQNHVQLWIKLFDPMERDPNADLPADVIRQIFRGYSMTTDNPGCTIYKQLMKMYPEAKVVLTVRDPKTWIQSVRETVRPKKPLFNSNWFGKLAERLAVAPGFGRMVEQTLKLCLGQDVDLTDDEQMIKGFQRWNETVQQVVPRDRLLIFHVKEGWEPLCRFLDKPIPAVPFPRENDRAEMKNRLSRIRRRVALLLASSVLVLGLVTAWCKM